MSRTYKILSNIFLSSSAPYAEEILGDYHCRSRCNRSTIDHIVYSAVVKYLRKMGAKFSSASVV